MGPPGGRPGSAGPRRQLPGAEAGPGGAASAATGRPNAVNPALLRMESTTTTSSAGRSGSVCRSIDIYYIGLYIT